MEVLPDRAHRWDLPPAEAAEVQRGLQSLLCIEAPQTRLRTIAGCDVSYDATTGLYYAAVLVFSVPGLQLLEQAEHTGTTGYPYIPGLLSFREAPVLLEAMRRLSMRPDGLLVDGQGLAHPRRMGLACHLGVLLDIPAVGCAKSLLVGKHHEPGRKKGSWTPLIHAGETVGAAVRTRDDVRPVYVSAGHRMDLDSSVQLVLSLARGYRLPEPTRRADQVVGQARKRATQGSEAGE